jgi:hypothetical protein
VDTPVTVTVLGPSNQPVLAGRVLEMSGQGLRLNVSAAIPCGAPVKIEGNDILLIGEVCHSGALESGYSIGLKIEHVLSSLGELARQKRELVGTDLPRRPVVFPSSGARAFANPLLTGSARLRPEKPVKSNC